MGEDKFLQTLSIIGITINTVGLLINGLSLSILYGKEPVFKSHLLLYIRHQTIMDALSCVVGILIMVKPGIWMTSYNTLDAILCYVWHSQMLYWIIYSASVFNVVIIAVDRYFCICHPVKYNAWSNTKGYCLLSIIYVLGTLPPIGTSLDMTYANGTCINKNILSGIHLVIFQYTFAVYYTTFLFLLPMVVWIMTYGAILIKLYKRSKITSLGNMRHINQASKEVLRSAVAVTVLFVAFTGYDLTIYVMSAFEIQVHYQIGSVSQITGLILVNCYSATNPLIYVIFVKKFRTKLFDKLGCSNNYCLKYSSTMEHIASHSRADETQTRF